jgi:choline dehydrogenase-like flavoprotein
VKIEDLRSLPHGSSVSTDVCIVGGGPAGVTLACELDGSGLQVVLLESGDIERDAWAESMNEITSVGAPRVLDTGEVRNRGLGGTSATWGGRVTTLSDIDFRERPWVPASGWPITRETLAFYYARAAAHIGMTISDPNDPAVLDFLGAHVPAPDGSDPLIPYLWSFGMHPSRRPDFLRFGARALAIGLNDVRCMVNATATHIDTDQAGRAVTRIEVTAPDRRQRWIDAQHVVLCAGGIENARLLLASNRMVRSGLGNEHGLVGRYLMDHPRGPVAWFPHGEEALVQRLLGDFLVRASALPASVRVPRTSRRTWLTPGYALSPDVQASEGLLNCALFLTSELADDDPLSAALGLATLREPIRNLGNLSRHAGLAAQAIPRMLRGRYPLRSLSGLYVQCIVEQRPNPDSRITLSDRTDILGVPVAQVDWRTSDQEATTVRRATRFFVDEMRRLGLPAPEPVAMIEDPESEFFLPDVAHPSGTTRMSADPKSGVVDPNCAVHGVDGLYAVGSSVFPTNGHANPTYTIVALAVRLADHLRAQPRYARDSSDRQHASAQR